MTEPSPPTSDLTALLRCPISAQPLKQILPGGCSRFPGEWKEGGYLSEDGQILYPIRDGFPLLVPSEAVHLVDLA